MLSLVGPKSSGGCYGYPRLPACAGAKHQWRQLRQCVPRRGAGESVAQHSYLVDKSKRRAVVSATYAAVKLRLERLRELLAEFNAPLVERGSKHDAIARVAKPK